MKRVISLSALISGLLALPAFAVMPPREQETVMPGAQSPGTGNLQPTLQDLHAAMEAGPNDIGGMKKLHRQMIADVQDLLNDQLADGPAATAPRDVDPRTGDHPQPARPAEAPGYIVGDSPVTFTPRMEKAAFLGVTTSPVAPTLREQLGLPKGFGLVLDYVEKDSPADHAGLKVHDVLQKLDDQFLINAPQLSVLVRSKKAGDEVTLSVIRAAKPIEIKARLSEKELPVLDDDPFHHPLWIQPNGTQGRVPETNPGTSSMATVMTRSDDTHAITISITNGQKHVSVKEVKTGKLLYDGPANTEDDLKDLPADIREKIKAMEHNLHKNLNPDQPAK